MALRFVLDTNRYRDFCTGDRDVLDRVTSTTCRHSRVWSEQQLHRPTSEVAVFTERGDHVRVISLRRANSREARRYAAA